MSVSYGEVPNGANLATARAGRVGFGAALIFTLLLALLHLLEPDYDPSWRFVSEYALGRYGWILPLAFVALAISLTATTVIAWQHSSGPLRYITTAILALAATGLCIAAIFPTDPITVPFDQATPAGRLHMLGGSMNYTPVAALLMGFALTRYPVWKSARTGLFGTAILTILSTIGFVASMPADLSFGPGSLTGWWNRLILLSYVCWIVTVCWNAVEISRREE